MTIETGGMKTRFWAAAEATVKIMVVLAGVQALRALVYFAGWTILKPSGTSEWCDVNLIVSLAVSGAALWAGLRLDKTKCGLGREAISGWGRMGLMFGGALLAGLVVMSFLLDGFKAATILQAAVVIPIYEEVIFRGWAWQSLEKAFGEKTTGLLTLVIISGLYAMWQFGYADMIFLRFVNGPVGTFSMRSILAMKVVTGGAVGLMTGFARLHTGKIYWPVLLHGLWNMFSM